MMTTVADVQQHKSSFAYLKFIIFCFKLCS